MVEWSVRYQNEADMYECVEVTVRGILKNLQLECDGLRNDLAAAREAKAEAVSNEGAAHAREAEALAAHDNARTELTNLRNCLNSFREWLSLAMPVLLNILDSIFMQGGQGDTSLASQRLCITS